MIFYLLGILGYYKLAKKAVPWTICLAFFAVVTIPPGTTLYLLLHKHWIFQLLAFAGGLFCWTFAEYFIHRFLMHEKEKKQYHKSQHFIHHTNPGKIFTGWFRRILLTAVAVALTWCSIFFTPYLALPAGFATGFALYTYVHMWLHRRGANKWMGGLQTFHIRHHCGQTESCFGVMTTWWDHLFNTANAGEKNIGGKAIELYFGNSTKNKSNAA